MSSHESSMQSAAQLAARFPFCFLLGTCPVTSLIHVRVPLSQPIATVGAIVAVFGWIGHLPYNNRTLLACPTHLEVSKKASDGFGVVSRNQVKLSRFVCRREGLL